jgi:transposase-like protein
MESIGEEKASGPKQLKRRRSYTVDKKLQVIAKYHELGQNILGASRVCGVPRGYVQEWIQREEEFSSLKKDRQVSVRRRRNKTARPGDDEAKRQAKYPRLEIELVSWLEGLRRDGVTVSSSCIQQQARRVFNELYNDHEEFTASNGWLSRFLKRHNLVSRAVTSQRTKSTRQCKRTSRELLYILGEEIRGTSIHRSMHRRNG